ncbi:Cation transport protein [Leptospira kirschneri serovar Mozdok]|nr:Cation transport protein [Leptospira kirschneri serovar Mozdok]
MNSVKDIIFKLSNIRRSITIFYQTKIYPFLRIYYSICGTISLCLLILIYGFYYPHEWTHWIRLLVNVIVVSLVVYEALSFIFVENNLFDYLKTHKTEAIVVFLIVFQEIISQEIYEILTLDSLSGEDASLAFLSLSQLFLLFSNFSRLIRKTELLNYRQISPSLVIAVSFGILILLGTLALSLPRAQTISISTIDVFFYGSKCGLCHRFEYDFGFHSTDRNGTNHPDDFDPNRRTRFDDPYRFFCDLFGGPS